MAFTYYIFRTDSLKAYGFNEISEDELIIHNKIQLTFLLAISLYTHHLLILPPVCHLPSLHHCTNEEHFGLQEVAQYTLDNSLHEAAAAAAAHVAHRPWSASSYDDSTGEGKGTTENLKVLILYS